jgi:hypothetical protein
LDWGLTVWGWKHMGRGETMQGIGRTTTAEKSENGTVGADLSELGRHPKNTVSEDREQEPWWCSGCGNTGRGAENLVGPTTLKPDDGARTGLWVRN